MGWGGSLVPSLIPANVQKLTGSESPQETVDLVLARSTGIIDRTDSILISNLRYDSTNPDIIPLLTTECIGTKCTVINPVTTAKIREFTKNDLVFAGTSKGILSKNGITIFESESEQFNSYGLAGSMHHSGFGFIVQRGNNFDGFVRYSSTLGDLSGSQPTSSATWRGLMLGTMISGPAKGNRLFGDAELNYNFSENSITSNFRNIKDLDLNRNHSSTTISFNPIQVSSTGTFHSGLSGNRIQGGFYGDDQSEMAGIFERSNIVGSFGAKKVN